MGHLCGTTCKRKNGEPCDTCRFTGGGRRVVILDAVPLRTGLKRPHTVKAECDVIGWFTAQWQAALVEA